MATKAKKGKAGPAKAAAAAVPAAADAEFKDIPITKGFDPSKIIGHARIKTSELPSTDGWVLSIGGRVKSSRKVGDRMVPDIEVTELGLINVVDHDVADQGKRMAESLDQAAAGFSEIAGMVGCAEGAHVPTAVKAHIGALTAERDDARQKLANHKAIPLERLRQLLPLTTPCAYCTVEAEGGHVRHEPTCPAAAVHRAS